MSIPSFEDTGLASPLVDAARTLGLDRPTALQGAALPIVRRGGNLALRGASGSGVTLAWAAGVLERAVESEGRPRVLVVTSDEARAHAVADTLSRLASAAGEGGEAWRALSVGALAPGWRSAEVDVLVAPAAAAAGAVAASGLKLDGVAILVLDDIAETLANESSALEALMASVPRDAQRILVTTAWSDAVDRFTDSSAKKALHVPSRSADVPVAPITRSVGALFVPESDKFDALCEILANRDAGDDVVLVRSSARAAALGADLARRGFGSTSGPAVASFDESQHASVAYDVPFDAAGLTLLAGSEPVVLATPRERVHLLSIAGEAGIGITSLTRPSSAPTAADAYRRTIADALGTEDIDAQVALLGPLFERHAPVEVAAALSALLRRKPQPAAPVAASVPRSAPPSARFVRLFISAGQKDGLRPADLVGAITGEAGISGDRVGRLDIRETFSIAEVGEEDAEKVIRALNGTTLRGRAVRVDYDRPGGGGGGGGAPARRRSTRA